MRVPRYKVSGSSLLFSDKSCPLIHNLETLDLNETLATLTDMESHGDKIPQMIQLMTRLRCLNLGNCQLNHLSGKARSWKWSKVKTCLERSLLWETISLDKVTFLYRRSPVPGKFHDIWSWHQTPPCKTMPNRLYNDYTVVPAYKTARIIWSQIEYSLKMQRRLFWKCK